MSLRDRLEDGLLALPDVELRPSRFGGKDAFFVGRCEFAHFEAEDVLDLRLTRAELRARREALRDDPRVEERPNGGDWVFLRVAEERDLVWALELAAAAVEANRPRS